MAKRKWNSEWNLQLTAWREEHARIVAAEMGFMIEVADVEVIVRNRDGNLEERTNSGLKAVKLTGMASNFTDWDKQRADFYRRLDVKAQILPKQRMQSEFPFTAREL